MLWRNSGMKVLVADKLGFCFGVREAIKIAERTAAAASSAEGAVYSLGPVIHNQQVVDRLAQQGLHTVETLAEAAAPGTVVIRSHGVSPDVIEQARDRGLQVVDATCVLVKRAQEIAARLHREGYRVVIIGDPNHPEVAGVLGYAPDIIVLDSADELDRLPRPPAAKLGILSQTTHSAEHFGRMVGLIAARGYRELKIVNTICSATAERQDAALALCRQVDVMFVLGGHHSANTNRLAEICRASGVPTFHIEGLHEFDSSMAVGHATAGVTAGASTPDWIIEQFVCRLQKI